MKSISLQNSVKAKSWFAETANNKDSLQCILVVSSAGYTMKHVFAFFVILLFLMVSFSCNQAEPVNPKANQNFPKNWYIPQELLEYFYFKQGTYWVYENDITGEIDSVVVSVAQKTMTNATQQGERYEVAYTDVVSMLDGFTYKYGISAQGSAGCIKNGSKWPCYHVSCNKYKIGDVKGENTMLVYPFVINHSGFADTRVGDKSKYIIKSFQDSILYNNKHLKNIVEFSVNYCLSRNNRDYVFYWSKGLGIFKMENTTDNETWNLIRFNIVK